MVWGSRGGHGESMYVWRKGEREGWRRKSRQSGKERKEKEGRKERKGIKRKMAPQSNKWVTAIAKVSTDSEPGRQKDLFRGL